MISLNSPHACGKLAAVSFRVYIDVFKKKMLIFLSLYIRELTSSDYRQFYGLMAEYEVTEVAHKSM